MTTPQNQQQRRQQLLVDEAEARRFYRDFLLLSSKPRLVMVNARKKYDDTNTLSISTQILERTILRFDKNHSEDDFIRFIQRVDLLVQAGFYRDRRDDSVPIALEWVVVYVTAFPLDEEDATDAFIQTIMKRRRNFRRAVANEKKKDQLPVLSNITSILTTCLHNSRCSESRRQLKLDVDTKDSALLEDLYRVLQGFSVVVAMATRGGYHVVIERNQDCRPLYEFVKNVQEGVPHKDHWITLEDNDGPMVAIPGTNQGGFAVQIATEHWRQALGTSSLETQNESAP